jgi:hypothetical protein
MKVHLYNKSGISHSRSLERINARVSRRPAYSTGEKLKILRVIKKMVEEDALTYSEASSALGLDNSMISRWRKKEDVFAAITRPDALIVHAGPTSILDEVTQDLLHFIDTWRSKGLPVNRIALVRKARSLVPELETKSEYAVKQSVSRWMTKHRLAHRMATHKAQRHPSEVEGEALDFLSYIRPILQERNRDPDFIINMDQTPVFHAMDFRMTIDRVGTRTVNLRTSAADSKRVTVAVTVTASGRRVKQMVVFKGEFVYCCTNSFHEDLHYSSRSSRLVSFRLFR